MTNAMGSILLIGVGATMLTDLWSVIRKQAFGVPQPNFALVGRWVGHMARGGFRHDSIAAAARIPAESAIGWATHYLIGMAFAFLLPVIGGPEWLDRPTLVPALLSGALTVAAPFFIMQPAMGAGFAASRTPHPAAARFHSLVMHLVFGVGLYAAGSAISLVRTG